MSAAVFAAAAAVAMLPLRVETCSSVPAVGRAGQLKACWVQFAVLSVGAVNQANDPYLHLAAADVHVMGQLALGA